MMNSTWQNDLPPSPAKHYEQLSTEFIKFHSHPLNVALHFLTTPIGLIGLFSFLHSYTKSSSATMTLTFFYLVSLLPILPIGEFVGTVLVCAAIVLGSKLIKFNLWTGFTIVIFSYILQDLAHYFTGEKTFQSTYSAGGHVRTTFVFSLFICLISFT
jgi:uncharacterized membrane protein YGL010W